MALDWTEVCCVVFVMCVYFFKLIYPHKIKGFYGHLWAKSYTTFNTNLLLPLSLDVDSINSTTLNRTVLALQRNTSHTEMFFHRTDWLAESFLINMSHFIVSQIKIKLPKLEVILFYCCQST